MPVNDDEKIVRFPVERSAEAIYKNARAAGTPDAMLSGLKQIVSAEVALPFREIIETIAEEFDAVTPRGRTPKDAAAVLHTRLGRTAALAWARRMELLASDPDFARQVREECEKLPD